MEGEGDGDGGDGDVEALLRGDVNELRVVI